MKKSTAFHALALGLLMALSAGTTTHAQRGGHHFRQNQPAHQEIKAYQQANITPVLKQQRQKLEQQLTAADRTQLTTYRTQLKALGEQRRALHESLAPANSQAGTRPTLTEAQLQERQELHTKTKAIMTSVAEMAKKYEEPIRQLAEEVQPQREKWEADMKAIAAKNATHEQQERAAAHGGHLRNRGGEHRFFQPTRFLLMDPNALAPSESSTGTTNFYPNPASATSQLEYNVKKAGPVTVELLDSRGNKLRTLVPTTTQEKGTHTQQLDLRDLPAGTYFYKITTASGSQTKRFVKE